MRQGFPNQNTNEPPAGREFYLSCYGWDQIKRYNPIFRNTQKARIGTQLSPPPALPRKQKY